jgi:hypothetical protein
VAAAPNELEALTARLHADTRRFRLTPHSAGARRHVVADDRRGPRPLRALRPLLARVQRDPREFRHRPGREGLRGPHRLRPRRRARRLDVRVPAASA